MKIKFSILAIYIILCNSAFAQKDDFEVGFAKCHLGNFKSCDIGYNNLQGEGTSYLEKYFPTKNYLINVIKNKIPKIKIVDTFAQCIVGLEFDIVDAQLGIEEVSYGNIFLKVWRRAKIEDVDCNYSVLYVVSEYSSKVLFMNPKGSKENIKLTLENVINGLVKEFASEYYLAN
ncbi:MAG: hypothetical protein JSS63_09475 [Bacteroidetes bacterium]|nr:hypothetical protein [Bacteroidota bacterium]